LSKIVLILSLSVYLFSYEKGNIDMHGGKDEQLITKKIEFAKKSIDYCQVQSKNVPICKANMHHLIA